MDSGSMAHAALAAQIGGLGCVARALPTRAAIVKTMTVASAPVEAIRDCRKAVSGDYAMCDAAIPQSPTLGTGSMKIGSLNLQFFERF